MEGGPGTCRALKWSSGRLAEYTKQARREGQQFHGRLLMVCPKRMGEYHLGIVVGADGPLAGRNTTEGSETKLPCMRLDGESSAAGRGLTDIASPVPELAVSCLHDAVPMRSMRRKES